MNELVERYPLSWPATWKRTPYGQRRAAMFSKRQTRGESGYRFKERLAVGDALERLDGELRRLGAQKVIISSNLRVRGDGLPYAQQAKQLNDPGIAVYFSLKGAPKVLACDRWSSAADNIAAIAGHIDAIRSQDRYGVGTIEQAFAGYTALPPSASENWWLILELKPDATIEAVDEAFKRLARVAHPDVGGSHDAMARLSEARTAAYKARR